MRNANCLHHRLTAAYRYSKMDVDVDREQEMLIFVDFAEKQIILSQEIGRAGLTFAECGQF